jgi:hypothetical protein
MFKKLQDRSEGEKKIIGLTLSLVITLFIIGGWIVYKKAINKVGETSVSFWSTKGFQNMKNQVGSIFNFTNSALKDFPLEEGENK